MLKSRYTEAACDAGDTGDSSLIPECGRSPMEGNDTHSSILAWRITWTEEPGRLHSPVGHRVKHD